MATKKGTGSRKKASKSSASLSVAPAAARVKRHLGRPPARAAAAQAVYGVLRVAGYAAESIRSGSRVRKNMDMDQRKLSEAQEFLGAKSETEAVNAALDLVVFQKELASGIAKMVRAGGVTAAFEE